MTTVIMRTTARIVVPIVLVVAFSLFLQGHNLPGGGFIGGVLTVAAFALVYVAYNLDYLESGVLGREVEREASIGQHRSVAAYRRLFMLGLVVILLSAFAGVVFGQPVLSQSFVHLHLPLFGDIELASALVFDIGIFCVVVGGLLTVFSVVSAE
ncbi:multicomponent Na+:H+ antiporter subunit B [Halovenus aranensis]|jgi:multicomponent Na+:H+ antiporter subunit B|uniref:Multicomponent Na+:H+ antiporter subunit B n=1 Tax=Halovenus aranensis TaxID=890420 RepID=A0A1G8U4N9_9EURY|nr:MnhB domain-containing protein [Halovenus aranensis]SDJ48065.1 multicomponent Na+:H+ antiporter subunit B [Halovenus aranensis]